MERATAIPAGLRTRADSWRAAENAIYPLAVTDTDAYQQAVALVGLLRTHFEAEATSIDALSAAADTAPAVLRSLAARAGMHTIGVDADAVVGCAAAARLRELLSMETSSLEDRSIAEARAAGVTWAMVAEPDLALAGTGAPMVWIEVHVESRARLVRGITMDPQTGNPLFTLEVMPPGESRPAMRLELDSRQEWLEEAEEIRLTFDQLDMGK